MGTSSYDSDIYSYINTTNDRYYIPLLYRVYQEETLIFWEVTAFSKQKSVYVYVSYSEWFPS
jgi:hypothetical protein